MKRSLQALTLGSALFAAGLLWTWRSGVRETFPVAMGELVEALPSGRPLPFRLRLESMGLDGSEGTPQVVLSEGRREWALAPQEGAALSRGGLTLTVAKVLPSALPEGAFRENPQAPPNPVLHLLLGLGTPVPLEGFLPSQDPLRRRFDEPLGRFSVLHLEQWDPALPERLKPRPGRLRLAFPGREFEHPAQPSTWSFEAFDLKIIEVYPDLGLETGKDGRPKAFHRSRMPRNPWVLVRLVQKGGGSGDLLVAAEPPDIPAYAASHQALLPPGTTLRYDRAGEELQRRFLVLTGDGQARLVEDGRVTRQEPLKERTPFVVAPGLSVTVLARMHRGEAVENYVPAEGPGMPAVQVQLHGKQDDLRWLGLERPAVSLPGTSWSLRYGPPSPPLELVRAQLKAFDPQGALRATRTLQGDETLELDGLTLRLAPGASRAGRWVRLEAVKDPGRWVWVAGVAVIILAALIEIRSRLSDSAARTR